MNNTTKFIIAIPLLALGLSGCLDTSPQRMAEIEVNTCFRNLPPSNDIFRVLERITALEQCNAMKTLYENAYKTKYNNY